MATVESVTGPIEAAELGVTLVHEHLLARDEAVHVAVAARGHGARAIHPRSVAPGGEYDEAVKAARSALELGVQTIFDPTAMLLGRDAAFMTPGRRARPASRCVACTGIYTYDHLPTFFVSRDPDQIAELFVADIEQGIQGTEREGGVHQVRRRRAGADRERREGPPRRRPRQPAHRGADHGPLSAGERDRAASRSRSSLEEGVDPAKVQIAHYGRHDRPRLHRATARDAASAIGLDRYGIEMYLPYEQRQATTLALLERGYADRIFLSADSCATLDWFPPETVEQLAGAGAVKDWDIRIVPERVLPDLR